MGKGVFGLKEEAALARTVIKKRLAGQPAPDIWFLIILMLLVCYGLVMLFSAGYAVALYRRGDAYTYIYKGIVATAKTLYLICRCLGMALMCGGAAMSCHFASRFGK